MLTCSVWKICDSGQECSNQRFSLFLDKYSDDLLSEQPYYSSFQLQVMQENLEHDISKVLEDF